MGGTCGRNQHWKCLDPGGSAIQHPDLADESPGLRDRWDPLPGGRALVDRLCDVAALDGEDDIRFACGDWLELLEALRE